MSSPFQIQAPDLRGVLNALRDEIRASLNCHQVGTIVLFDETKLKAQVSINVKRVVFNQVQPLGAKLQETPAIIDYPLLVDVPVFQLYGGTAFVSMPVKAGDTCVVLFNDRDIDNWFMSGATVEPNSSRMHDLSDGMAIVGFRSLAKPPALTDQSALMLSNSGALIKLKDSGDFEIGSNAHAHVNSNGALVVISNDTGTLKTALDLLYTALLAWINTGGTTPNPATLTALTAAKTATDAILG